MSYNSMRVQIRAKQAPNITDHSKADRHHNPADSSTDRYHHSNPPFESVNLKEANEGMHLFSSFENEFNPSIELPQLMMTPARICEDFNPI